MEFRVLKQVPRLLFRPTSLRRLNEMAPAKQEKGDYFIYVVDDVHRNGQIGSRLTIDAGDVVEWFPATAGEPTTTQVDELRDRVKEARDGLLPTAIIGIGGGSTMDVAKALSVMLRN